MRGEPISDARISPSLASDDNICIVMYCRVLSCLVMYCLVTYCLVVYCFVVYCLVMYCLVMCWLVIYCQKYMIARQLHDDGVLTRGCFSGVRRDGMVLPCHLRGKCVRCADVSARFHGARRDGVVPPRYLRGKCSDARMSPRASMVPDAMG